MGKNITKKEMEALRDAASKYADKRVSVIADELAIVRDDSSLSDLQRARDIKLVLGRHLALAYANGFFQLKDFEDNRTNEKGSPRIIRR